MLLAPFETLLPLWDVVTPEGSGQARRYSFRQEHWKAALASLAFGVLIPVKELALFLYRDYAVNGDALVAGAFVAAFRREFGYQNQQEFDHLFTMETSLREISVQELT